MFTVFFRSVKNGKNLKDKDNQYFLDDKINKNDFNEIFWNSWTSWSEVLWSMNIINEQTNQRLLFWVNTYYKYCIQIAMLSTINEIKSRGYKRKYITLNKTTTHVKEKQL